MRTLAGMTAVVLCLAVSACAGTGGTRNVERDSAMDAKLDVGKVVTVNQWAVHRHATVMWVNYPVTSRKDNNEG